MCKRNKWPVFFGMTLLCAGLALSNPCSAKQIGSVNAFEGVAKVNNSDETEARVLKTKGSVKLNDSIQTEQNSKIHVKLKDNSDNSLGGSSEIYFYDFDRQGSAQFYGADVTSGLIRFVKKLTQTTPPSSYTVTTPTAIINVQPGDPADFVVQVLGQKRTTVMVIWGKIRVKNVLDDIPTERVLTSCRRVDIEESKPPSRVMGVSSNTLKDLLIRTTIPGTLSEDVPNCGETFTTKRECPSRHIWDGTRCVPCRELGLTLENGKCVPPDCGDCKVLWGSRCSPCREIGLVCVEGRCVRKSCPPCAIWDGRRCVPCEESGRSCVSERCVSRRDCPPCSVWNGWRCVSCADLGRTCVDGKCVFRPCGQCESRRGDACLKCEELGLRCEKGRCISPDSGPGEGPETKVSPHPAGPITRPTPALPIIPPLKPLIGPERTHTGGTKKTPLKPAIPLKPADKNSSGTETIRPQLNPNESGALAPISHKQQPLIEDKRVKPLKPKPVEAPPALKSNEMKHERSLRHQKKQEDQPAVSPETPPPAVKQEKKQMRIERPAPIGRPDLKPEFARPDRAPGPPLGDRPGEDEKRKRN